MGMGVHASQGVQAAGSTSSNTLTIGWNLDSKNFDPDANAGNAEEWVQVNIYDQLVRVGSNGTSIKPDLATSWTMSPNGLTYIFHLRPHAVFSNGQQVTASDVKFCLNRARGAKELWAWTLAAIKGITTPNARTVRITLKHRWAPFLSDLSLVDGGVYPASYFKQHGASYLASHPIGSGPYMLAQWKPGQSILLQKNSRYWAASQFPMQYVEFETITSDNTRMLKAEAGELDVDVDLPANLATTLQSNANTRPKLFTSTRTIYLIPNLKTTQLADPKVREAINHAIDRQAMVKAVLHGYGTPANSFMPRGAIDYNPNIPVPSYNLTLAKQLMAQSKYPKGFTLTMTVGAGDSEGNETAVILKSELAPLGINLQIRQMDPTAMLSAEEAGHFTFTTNQWTNDISDPDELVAFAVDASSGDHSWFSFYNSPQITTLSHQAERSTSAAARKQLYFHIQRIWANDTPYFALYYPKYIDAVSTKVHGFSQIPLGYFNLRGVTKS
jgi:peptide/nickel transport system substrate-binding protein